MSINTIYNADCFDVLDIIKDDSIDCVIVDLPYGQTKISWDIEIDLIKMWDLLRQKCKTNAQLIFFCTTRFGYKLIQSNPKCFRYDLVWKKHNKVGFLSANKMPLRSHEMIYIFNNQKNDYNLELRDYSKKIKDYINLPLAKISKDLGSRSIEHFLSWRGIQFAKPTRETYEKLIKLYNIDKMEGFIPYDNLNFVKITAKTYNPQKEKGKPYKRLENNGRMLEHYSLATDYSIINNGDRFPSSILDFKMNDKHFHQTQKPVSLCEWLVRTYSNEGDTVLDFCMGSGSTILACLKSNRQFIGVEKEHEIFNKTSKRIDEYLNQQDETN